MKTEKTLVEILREVKERHLNDKDTGSQNCTERLYSLCTTAGQIFMRSDSVRFKTFLNRMNKNKKVFYRTTFANNKRGIVKTTDRSMFHWHPANHQVRTNWLDKHILEQSKTQ